MTALFQKLKDTFSAFIEDECLTRGAAISFYTATSFAPVLLLIIAVAGLVFGRDAAQGALSGQLSEVFGKETADFLQTVVAKSADASTGILSSIVSGVMLLVTASGVFGEMQAALNRIWKAEPKSGTLSRLLRARATSLGLVAALGFMMMVSLAVSAALTAFEAQINQWLPGGAWLAAALNTALSIALLSVIFAAIYKVLPDTPLHWRDVIFGAVVTATLFTVGKFLIGWYLGSSAIASAYGAAGSLILLMMWVYYSAMIFLFGAEVTKTVSISAGHGPEPAKSPQPA